jgi:uncharacterized membrane protein
VIVLLGLVAALILGGVLTLFYSTRYHELHVWKTCFFCGASGYVRRDDPDPICPRCEACL